jgi:hypothetical protein
MATIPAFDKSKAILIDIGGAYLQIDPAFELERARFIQPLMVAHGRPFNNSQPFPLEYLRADMRPGECFRNATLMAMDGELTYCEGLMVCRTARGLVSMRHAWCCDAQGNVIDPTCPEAQAHPNTRYVGLTFQTNYVLAWVDLTGFYGLMDGHPEHGNTVGVFVDPPEMWKKHLDI